jgi:Icc-related predicted phosphoesterase
MPSSLSGVVGFALSQQKSKRKYRRIFFATDLHSSEIVFRRFIGAAKFYEADALIMGGDVTGKNVVPLVKGDDGRYRFNFQGQEFRGISEDQISDYENRIMNAGIYHYRVSESEYENTRSDPDKVSAIFDRLMVDRLNSWAAMAKEHLEPLGVKCYWTGGNDDQEKILQSVQQNEFFVNVEEKVIKLDEEHEMMSFGWSNPTPWKTPRECNEEELASRLAKVADLVQEVGSCVYNIHPPPFDSTLDIAAKLDTSFDPPKAVTSAGNVVWIPVGSSAVRELIEKTQPLLMLCGHIHETKNATKIKRTTCINPGSEYGSGILRGVIVNLQKDKVLSYQFTSG